MGNEGHRTGGERRKVREDVGAKELPARTPNEQEQESLNAFNPIIRSANKVFDLPKRERIKVCVECLEQIEEAEKEGILVERHKTIVDGVKDRLLQEKNSLEPKSRTNPKKVDEKKDEEKSESITIGGSGKTEEKDKVGDSHERAKESDSSGRKRSAHDDKEEAKDDESGSPEPASTQAQEKPGSGWKPGSSDKDSPFSMKSGLSGSLLMREHGRKIATVLVVVMLLFLLVASMARDTDPVTVNIPFKKIGDKAEYEVEGTLSAASEAGFETDFGLLKGFDVGFSGTLKQQVNNTTAVKDGFDKDHKVVVQYLYQNLDVDGTVDLVGLEPKLRNGKLVTHQTDYTDLRTNRTVRYYLANMFGITIPTTDPPSFSKDIFSIDKGTFFTSSAQSTNILSFLSADFQNNLIPEEVSEGDSNQSEEYNLKWKASGTKTIAGYESLAIIVTEITPSDWYDVELKYWIASGCPYPTKIEANGWIDTGEMGGDIVSDLLRILSGSSKIQLHYEATLTNFEKGTEDIPYGLCFGDHDISSRLPSETIKYVDWYPEDDYRVPIAFANEQENETSGFNEDFLAEEAYDFALNTSEGMEDYFKDNKKAYAVEGEYFFNNDQRPVWDLTFGYFKKTNDLDALINPTLTDAYNVRLIQKKNGTNLTTELLREEEDVEILKPDRANSDMRDVLSFASAENIFREDEETRGFAFKEIFVLEGEHYVPAYTIDFGNATFRWSTNSVGASTGLISQYVPDTFDVPTLLSYNLIVNSTKNKGETVYQDAMLSGETGMRVYVRFHRDNFL